MVSNHGEIEMKNDGFVKCKRCGEEGLTWIQSKNGKWLLVRAYRDDETGMAVPAKLKSNKNLYKLHKCIDPKKEEEKLKFYEENIKPKTIEFFSKFASDVDSDKCPKCGTKLVVASKVTNKEGEIESFLVYCPNADVCRCGLGKIWND